uniref:BCL2 interacting killer n=1 Tax=Piliocolobus tephrosceles TaxID=591936 RepID=A0A8C9LQ67_9PRIM
MPFRPQSRIPRSGCERLLPGRGGEGPGRGGRGGAPGPIRSRAGSRAVDTKLLRWLTDAASIAAASDMLALQLACIGDEMDVSLRAPRLAQLSEVAMHSLGLAFIYDQTDDIRDVLRSFMDGFTTLKENIMRFWRSPNPGSRVRAFRFLTLTGSAASGGCQSCSSGRHSPHHSLSSAVSSLSTSAWSHRLLSLGFLVMSAQTSAWSWVSLWPESLHLADRILVSSPGQRPPEQPSWQPGPILHCPPPGQLIALTCVHPLPVSHRLAAAGLFGHVLRATFPLS